LPNTPIQSFFYFYRSTITGNKDFTFNIISYDTAQHVVLGSFEGSSQHRREFADHVGSTHYIKGVFHFKLK